jgi:hypothetical protein
MFSVYRLDLDRYFEICFGIGGLVNLSEGSFINLSDDFEIFTDFL